jgi:hypothetical protein
MKNCEHTSETKVQKWTQVKWDHDITEIFFIEIYLLIKMKNYEHMKQKQLYR